MSVGTRLREERVKQGFTLEDISAKTRILLKNLHAIESDDLSKLSSPFIYRSFTRQFAEELKLDFGDLAPAVQEASSSMPRPLVPGEDDIPVVRPAPLKVRDRAGSRWLYPAASFLLLILLSSGFYAFKRRGGAEPVKTSVSATPSRLNKSEKPAPAIPGVAPGRAQGVVPLASETVVTMSVPARPTVAPSAAEPAIHLEVSAITPTWVLVTTDGRQVYRGMLAKAETKILDGRETARIRTGNSGGVINVVFNGRMLGTLGRRGHTATFIFTKNGYETLPDNANMGLTRFSPNGE